MADHRNRQKIVGGEGLLTYAYIFIYIALSSGQIFFNKVPPGLFLSNQFLYAIAAMRTHINYTNFLTLSS